MSLSVMHLYFQVLDNSINVTNLICFGGNTLIACRKYIFLTQYLWLLQVKLTKKVSYQTVKLVLNIEMLILY